MKIVMLSSGDRVPSSRFRMLPYVRNFRASGHRCTLASSLPQKYEWFPTIGFRLSQRLKRLVRYLHWYQSRIRADDVVVIDREIFDSSCSKLEECFRRTTARFVLDLDDAVFQRYPEKFEKLTRLADLIVCGNSFIEEWARQRNENTIVIPTCVEMAQYAAKDWSDAGDRIPRIGWIGTSGNLRYFKVAAKGLRRLAEKVDYELHVIVPEIEPLAEVDLKGVRIRHVPWRKDIEVDQLRQIDVGLMPLFAADEWDRYKCGLKLIQYMAAGIPAVASTVGVNATIIDHGRNGFLAESDDDWATPLESLTRDLNLRRSIGDAARETAAARYSIEANYPRYEAALKHLLSTSQS
ncbi:MAG: glycosyltransferase family 4 protein [Planctomycetaceae bacterium]|jgi:glycosyltransferase involved in cell wall biosynthesis|nr:glycosyltransferase family 4 protein [Planctomycetaceae bacterium]